MNCLSLPNRSNQPFQKKKSDRRKVRGLLETTRNAFYIGRGQDYYVAMEASLKLKRNFLHPMKASLRVS